MWIAAECSTVAAVERLAPLLAVALVGLVAVAVARASRLPHRPPHFDGWVCVHRHEQSAWNDPNAPYYGGLQMGTWFMTTYARRLLRVKGTADRWTPLEQMWVAEKAWKRERYSLTWLRGQWPTSYGCL